MVIGIVHLHKAYLLWHPSVSDGASGLKSTTLNGMPSTILALLYWRPPLGEQRYQALLVQDSFGPSSSMSHVMTHFMKLTDLS